MRAVVTCENCGFRQEPVREITAPVAFHLICHKCEQSLEVSIDEAAIRTFNATAPKTGWLGKLRT